MSFRKTFLRNFVKLVIRKKSTWLNSIFKEAVFGQGFVPLIVRDHSFFLKWEKLGFHISENHYYHPIPNLSLIKDEFWTTAASLKGIELNLSGQLQLLEEVNSAYASRFNAFPQHKIEVNNPWEFFLQNQNFTSVDSEILYSIVRKFKPARIIEVGSGYTTFLFSKAIEDEKSENTEYNVVFEAIEPYPRDFLKTNIPKLTSLTTTPVQQVPLAFFETLQENDILFIDGSHMLKYGSDVEHVFFNILPILKKGVLIHFHDIFLPLPYPKEWVYDLGWFWNEQYLLQAFLMFNQSFEIMWSGSMMHNYHPDKLKDVFYSYSNTNSNPGSFWIKKVK